MAAAIAYMLFISLLIEITKCKREEFYKKDIKSIEEYGYTHCTSPFWSL